MRVHKSFLRVFRGLYEVLSRFPQGVYRFYKGALRSEAGFQLRGCQCRLQVVAVCRDC